MVSGNRVLGRTYGVWEQGVWGGKCMVSGNRVFGGKMYGVWEQGVWGKNVWCLVQGAGENIWCLGTGCWGEYMVSGNRVLGRIYGVWQQGAGENVCSYRILVRGNGVNSQLDRPRCR